MSRYTDYVAAIFNLKQYGVSKFSKHGQALQSKSSFEFQKVNNAKYKYFDFLEMKKNFSKIQIAEYSWPDNMTHLLTCWPTSFSERSERK